MKKTHKRQLLERFGQPIGKQVATVGAKDEGPGSKKTYKDDALERAWSDPKVVRETMLLKSYVKNILAELYDEKSWMMVTPDDMDKEDPDAKENSTDKGEAKKDYTEDGV